MTDPGFANNPSLLAVLSALGAKAAHCILCYLASRRNRGKVTAANTPQPSTYAKKGFLKRPFLFNLFCLRWGTKERPRSFKRRENQEMEGQRGQEGRRIWFLYSVCRRTKPHKTASRAVRRAGSSRRRTKPCPTPELVSRASTSAAPGARFQVNWMQRWGW